MNSETMFEMSTVPVIGYRQIFVKTPYVYQVSTNGIGPVTELLSHESQK